MIFIEQTRTYVSSLSILDYIHFISIALCIVDILPYLLSIALSNMIKEHVYEILVLTVVSTNIDPGKPAHPRSQARESVGRNHKEGLKLWFPL